MNRGADASPTSWSTVTVSKEGRSFSARLVHPLGGSDGVCPVVAFGHGFLQASKRYASTLAGIAARGYVVIAPDSETGLLPRHGRLADDLDQAIWWTRARVRAAHPSLAAVAGHSMGGGAALLAASRSGEIGAAVTLAAAETSPSAVAASREISAPTLFVVGSLDRLVQPPTTRAMYDAVPGPSRFASITGGYHCGFNDSTTFGGLACDSGTISRAEQLTLTQEVVGDWLDVTLRGALAGRSPSGVVVETKER